MSKFWFNWIKYGAVSYLLSCTVHAHYNLFLIWNCSYLSKNCGFWVSEKFLVIQTALQYKPQLIWFTYIDLKSAPYFPPLFFIFQSTEENKNVCMCLNLLKKNFKQRKINKKKDESWKKIMIIIDKYPLFIRVNCNIVTELLTYLCTFRLITLEIKGFKNINGRSLHFFLVV